MQTVNPPSGKYRVGIHRVRNIEHEPTEREISHGNIKPVDQGTRIAIRKNRSDWQVQVGCEHRDCTKFLGMKLAKIYFLHLTRNCSTFLDWSGLVNYATGTQLMQTELHYISCFGKLTEHYIYRITPHLLYQKVMFIELHGISCIGWLAMFKELHCISCIGWLCLQNCTAFLVSDGYVYRIARHFLYQKVMFIELHGISCIGMLCLQNYTAFLVSEGYVYRIAWHFLYRMVMFTELHCISCIRRLCLQNYTAFLVPEDDVYRIALHFLYWKVMFTELHGISCIRRWCL